MQSFDSQTLLGPHSYQYVRSTHTHIHTHTSPTGREMRFQTFGVECNQCNRTGRQILSNK